MLKRAENAIAIEKLAFVSVQIENNSTLFYKHFSGKIVWSNFMLLDGYTSKYFEKHKLFTISFGRYSKTFYYHVCFKFEVYKNSFNSDKYVW